MLKKKLDSYVKEGKLTEHLAKTLHQFFLSYMEAVTNNGYPKEKAEPLIEQLASFAVKQLSHPYRFEPFHRRIVKPFNYYQFGLDLIRPLIDMQRSSLRHPEVVDQIQNYLDAGDNVVLFANHQTEPDPQIISILLEKTHPKLAEEMIFVAGHRVITDPLAVPFSKGRNLLCIYSKKHIEHPIELKAEKQLHNQRTMKKLSALLSKGGNCIYVAPSGGRDRLDASGNVEVAKFDPQSIDFFLLMAAKAKHQTHFFPLTLATYHLLPPPNSVEKEIGEQRQANSVPVHLSFGQELDLNKISKNFSSLSKLEQRKRRAEYIWSLVQQEYATL